MINYKLMQNVHAYLDELVKYYENFIDRQPMSHMEKMRSLSRFVLGLDYVVTSTYIKVRVCDGAHSFILIENSGKRKIGEIYGPKGYDLPRFENKIGNIFDLYNLELSDFYFHVK